MVTAMDHVDRLFINLKIIASIQPTQKLNTKGGENLVIESGYWIAPSISRWFRDDGRMNAVKRLGEIIGDAGRLHAETPEIRVRLSEQIELALDGLKNLRQTYECDLTIAAHFDVLLEKLAALSQRHRSDPSCDRDS